MTSQDFIKCNYVKDVSLKRHGKLLGHGNKKHQSGAFYFSFSIFDTFSMAMSFVRISLISTSS